MVECWRAGVLDGWNWRGVTRSGECVAQQTRWGERWGYWGGLENEGELAMAGSL